MLQLWIWNNQSLIQLFRIIRTSTHLTTRLISPENSQNCSFHDNAIYESFLWISACNFPEQHRRYEGSQDEKSNELHEFKWTENKTLLRPKIQINWIRSPMKCKWDERWKCSRELCTWEQCGRTGCGLVSLHMRHWHRRVTLIHVKFDLFNRSPGMRI